MATRKVTSTKGKVTPSPSSITIQQGIKRLGATATSRILGVPASTVKSWERDPEKIPSKVKRTSELEFTLRRFSSMENRAAKVRKVNKETRADLFANYVELASKSSLRKKENAKIVNILLTLGIDPHRPESYLRGAT